MKRILHIYPIALLAIFLLPLVVSCSGKVEKKLDDIESYVNERPDSALGTLCAIPSEKLTCRRVKARHSLLYAMALDKNFIDTADVSVVMPAVEYYRKHGSGDEKLKSLYYLAKINKNAGNIRDAIFAAMEARQYSDESEDYKYRGLLSWEMSELMRRSYNHEESFRYDKDAYENFSKGGLRDYALNSLIYVAEDYTDMNMWRQADSTFKDLLSEGIPEILLPYWQGAYAMLKVLQPDPDYKEAERLFTSSYRQYGNEDYPNRFGAYAYALYVNGKEHQADSVFSSLRESGDATSLCVYYSWKGKAEEFSGRTDSALDYLKKFKAAEDSLLYDILQQPSVIAQRDYLASSEARAKEEASKQKRATVSLILLFALLGSIAYLLYKRHEESSMREMEKLLEIAEVAQSQVKEAQSTHEDDVRNLRDSSERVSQLEHLVEDNDRKMADLRKSFSRIYKSQFSEIGQLIEVFNKSPKSEAHQQKVYKKVEQILSDMGYDAEGQKKLEEKINRNFNGLMAHFREDFPNLKEADYRIASYIFVGFDATTISNVMMLPSKSSAYMRKKRMKEMVEQSSSPYREDYLFHLG